MRIRDNEILKVQQRYKISVKMMDGQRGVLVTEKSEPYERYVFIEGDSQTIRKVCPFEVVKALAHGYEVSNEDITAQKKRFLVKAPSLEQYNRICQVGPIGL